MNGAGTAVAGPANDDDDDDDVDAMIEDQFTLDGGDAAAPVDDEPPVEEQADACANGAAGDVAGATAAEFRQLAGRPPLEAPVQPERDALVFLQSACDCIVERHDGVERPIMRLYGVTAAGHSVLCRVRGFLPYFYVPAPAAFDESQIAAFQRALDAATAQRARVHQHQYQQHAASPAAPRAQQCVLAVALVRKRSVLYYTPGDPEVPFLCITVAQPQFIRHASGALRDGAVCGQSFMPFDSSVDSVLRFMIDTGMTGCSWVELPPRTYEVAPDASRTSPMQIEAGVADWRALVCHAPEGDWLRTAPLRIMSFDIECAGRKGVFPEAQTDSVIQIACHVSRYGASEPLARIVLALDSCAAIPGAHVVSFEREEALLQAFCHLCVAADPDILTGYNIVNFDMPYLLERAEHLGVGRFPYLGRVSASRTRMRRTKMSSSAFGTHDSAVFSIDGRVVMDMLQVVIRDYKLRSYSLNSVSFEFLGEQKEDVHYSIITDLQQGNEHTRRRLAVYCLKDALLPQRLMDKLLSLTNYMELARVTGIPLDWLLTRGHMVKVTSLLQRKSAQVDLLVPDVPKDQASGGGQSGGGGGGGGEGGGGPQYEGATVIEPRKGFYTAPITTLDFASLYPSIMMAHNLCYSTLVRQDDVDRLSPDDYVRTPAGHAFVKPSVKKGVLSVILEELLSSRKVAKRDMAVATDPFLKEVLNGRQLALKISANAVYGFTGASVGKLPCMEISASVTAYGREMIEFTKSTVESLYPDASVVYGDTDSVMVRFGDGLSIARAMELGTEAATALSARFPQPVRLEFEKVYFPFLLISKKRYAGLFWTRAEAHDKMDCKGIESVRRDNCRLVANVVSTVLRKLLVDQDVDAAIEYVKRIVRDLLQNRIDLSLLVVSKALTRETDAYDSKQAHVYLVEKLRKRDRGSAPSLGDRVPYVIVKGAKNEKAYMRAEDPTYVLENNLPVDAQYYLEHMLRKPLERIFSGVMKQPESLFTGAHTRAIHVSTPRGTGIMKFAKVKLNCLGCRAPIDEDELRRLGLPGTALCRHCRPREAEVYRRVLGESSQLEHAHNSLWTQCQSCMGSVVQDVLCSNGDCPIFYRRRKVQKDLQDAQKNLARFAEDW